MAITTSNVAAVFQVIFDIALYLAVSALVVLLMMKVPPRDSGFFCDDPDIRYPKYEDTVTSLHLLVVGVGAPLATILVLEFIYKIFLARRKNERLANLVLVVGKLIGLFMFGLAVTMLITEALKISVGRQRPHFIHTCKPDLSPFNCTQGHVHVVGANCTNDLPKFNLWDARKSFPSGHASLGFYSATYFVLYLEHRLELPFSLFLKSLIQLAAVLMAIFCAGSRVSDNRHFPGDCLVGAAIGTAMGFWTVFILAKHLRHESITKPTGGTETVVYMDPTVKYRREQSTCSGRSTAVFSSVSENAV